MPQLETILLQCAGEAGGTRTHGRLEDDVETLSKTVSATQYSFLSPHQDQSSPIVLTAWGHQLKFDTASDPRVAQFMSTLGRHQHAQDRFMRAPRAPGLQRMRGSADSPQFPLRNH
ncbi:DUF3105 domain-containing protein [Streptomyces himalayensis]|nr:DUF3105 domain-containing protein [Streptomyces himalayensis]